jgi:hypothetical protein
MHSGIGRRKHLDLCLRSAEVDCDGTAHSYIECLPRLSCPTRTRATRQFVGNARCSKVDTMKAFTRAVQRHPRISAALLFGLVTAAAVYFTSSATIRLSANGRWLIFAISVAHSVAGAFTGARFVRKPYLRPFQALLLGASTSLAALLLFAPFLTWWLFSDGTTRSTGHLSVLAMTALVGLFSFAAVGWALMTLAGLTGWVLSRVAVDSSRS